MAGGRRGGARPGPVHLLALVVVGSGVAAAVGNEPEPNVRALQEAAPREDPSPEDFVGAEACRSCHADQYEAWAASTHGNAGGAPGPDVILAPFDDEVIRFRDAVVTPATSPEGGYLFRVAREGRGLRVVRVDAVVGGGHLLGGGTQGYLTRDVDGTVRLLPFEWSPDAGVWFCNTNGRTDQGFVPITPDLPLSACTDWPPRRILGDEPRFPDNCQACHGSQIQVAFDGEARRYETDWTTLRVNCESCHGPGREHVERARAAGPGSGEDLAMRSLAVRSKDEAMDVCFRCHALKSSLEEGYLPGSGFDEHYSLELPHLGEEALHPDGRVRTFAYQANHRYSRCYLDGAMECGSCHTPHGQGYRDVFGNALDSPFDDGQCTSCHAAKAEAPEAHTFHPPESEGARCVSCHMPYIQQPRLGDEIPYGRSDHTVSVPRPGLEEALEIQGACLACHEEMGRAEVAARTEAWWGELAPPSPVAEALVRGVEPGADPARAWALLVEAARDHVPYRIRGLERYVARHLDPGASSLPTGARDDLRGMSAGGDPDLSALAMTTLLLADGGDPTTARFVEERLAGATAAERTSLRRRIVSTMKTRAEVYRAEGDLDAAEHALERALGLAPTDPGLHLEMGLVHRVRGDLEAAVGAYQRSLELDPDAPLTWINLGGALAMAGDVDGAASAFGRAAGINPYEPLAYLNLGTTYLARGRTPEAIRAYRRALDLDESLVDAHFLLGRALVQSERLEEARASLQRALEYDPGHPEARQLLERVEEALRSPGQDT